MERGLRTREVAARCQGTIVYAENEKSHDDCVVLAVTNAHE